MMLASRRLKLSEAGFSKLEFVVVTIIFAILFSGYLRVTRHYQELAEEATVNLLLANIRTGMAQEWVDRIAKTKTRDGVNELVGANPVRWLESPPVNYLGELKSARVDSLKVGYWYFDLSRKELGYVVNVDDHLEIEHSGARKVLRWKVVLEHNSTINAPDFGDLVLVPVSDYRWF